MPELIDFLNIGSPDLGYLSVVEGAQIPFQIKRVYWTYYTPNDVIRGNHSHKNLKQILIATSGIIECNLEDAEGKSYYFKLTSPSQGLFVPPGYWRTLCFSHNAVLLCLASEEFSESDYIRSYEKFRKTRI